MREDLRKLTLSPTLPRKRGREQTESVAAVLPLLTIAREQSLLH